MDEHLPPSERSTFGQSRAGVPDVLNSSLILHRLERGKCRCLTLQIAKFRNTRVTFSCECASSLTTMRSESACVCSDAEQLVFENSLSDGLALRSIIDGGCAEGVWRRTDILINCSDRALEVRRPAAGFILPGYVPRIDAVSSTWRHEAQRTAIDIGLLSHKFGSKGRTCSGHAPHFEIQGEYGMCIIDLMPCGDWSCEIYRTDEGVLLEYGHYDDETSISVAPGQSVEFGVECLIRFAADPRQAENFVQLQSYSNRNLARRGARTLPVVYNTWFDRFAKISIESMCTQLEAAQKIGCEVFVIDAGWFGSRYDDWTSVGDWCENPNVFADTSLRDFADTVRANGLQFGIWMNGKGQYKFLSQNSSSQLVHRFGYARILLSRPVCSRRL